MAKPKILQHIHAQPDHIRELWVIVSTVIVALIVLAIWFRSFNNNIYGLLNPGQAPATNQNLAAASSGTTPMSLFGYIGQAMQDGKAQISGLFNSSSSVSTTQSTNSDQSLTSSSVHAMPVSGNR